jgi:hypothetical protein
MRRRADRNRGFEHFVGKVLRLSSTCRPDMPLWSSSMLRPMGGARSTVIRKTQCRTSWHLGPPGISCPGTMSNNSLVRQRNRALILVLAAGNLFQACSTLEAPEGRAPAAGARESLAQCMASLSHERAEAGRAVNTLSPGTRPAAARGRPDQGVKYLLSQMSMKDRASHVPSCSDSQQTWQDWFDKLAEVPVHCEVSAETIIHTVTGHLPSPGQGATFREQGN